MGRKKEGLVKPSSVKLLRVSLSFVINLFHFIAQFISVIGLYSVID